MKKKNHFFHRQRNGDWELKYPVGTSPRTSLTNGDLEQQKKEEDDEKTTVYHETSNSEDIISKLKSLPTEQFPEVRSYPFS